MQLPKIDSEQFSVLEHFLSPSFKKNSSSHVRHVPFSLLISLQFLKSSKYKYLHIFNSDSFPIKTKLSSHWMHSPLYAILQFPLYEHPPFLSGTKPNSHLLHNSPCKLHTLQ